MLKKIVHYLFISIFCGFLFILVDMISQKAMFNSKNNALTDFGLSNMGIGQLDITNLGIEGLDLGSLGFSGGTCFGKKPLMLVTGECVACNYNGSVDVLMGCEQCSRTKVKCLFGSQVHAKKTTKSTKTHDQWLKNEHKKLSKKHKYILVNIIGADDEMHANLIETATGHKKTISVCDVLDGAIVKSISADGRIVVEKNGVVKNLDIERQ